MLYIPYHTHCRLTDLTDLTDKGIYNEDTSIFFLVKGWLLRNLRSSRKIEYIMKIPLFSFSPKGGLYGFHGLGGKINIKRYNEKKKKKERKKERKKNIYILFFFFLLLLLFFFFSSLYLFIFYFSAKSVKSVQSPLSVRKKIEVSSLNIQFSRELREFRKNHPSVRKKNRCFLIIYSFFP